MRPDRRFPVDARPGESTPEGDDHRSFRSALVETLDALARRAYDAICGTHPNLRCCHFQWLAVRDLHKDLRRVLPGIRGCVLDVGCGEKPYASWFLNVDRDRIVGIDVAPGPGVDVDVEDGKRWPFADASFDAVLCTQVLEHAADLDGTLKEIYRVLVPSGTVVATFPFLYHLHGAPRDFRRFSVHEAVRLFSGRYEIVEAGTQGRFGSTVCTMLLSWLWTIWDRRSPTRVVKIPLLPAWIAATLFLNGLGLLLDGLDSTGAYYGNVLVVARKRIVEG